MQRNDVPGEQCSVDFGRKTREFCELCKELERSVSWIDATREPSFGRGGDVLLAKGTERLDQARRDFKKIFGVADVVGAPEQRFNAEAAIEHHAKPTVVPGCGTERSLR